MARDFVRASSQFLGNSSTPVTAAPLTLACWFNCDDNTNSQDVISIADTAASDQAFRLNLGGNAAGDPVRAVVTSGVSTVLAVTSSGYTAGQWHHACAVFASSTSRAAYIDGGSKGTNADSNTPSSLDAIAIGRISWATPPATYYDGRVAEAVIWNAALTDAEVLLLSKGYSPLLVRPASLVAYWPLTGRASAEHDPVGKFDLTVTGATQAAHPRIIYPSSRVIVPVAAAAAAASGHHKHLTLLGAA